MRTKKIFTTLSLFLIFFVISSYQVKAQSAVYFCTETGAYGFAYGHSSVSSAKDAAYDACEEYGGTNPVLVTSSSSKGYGAIAIGVSSDGGSVIGAALGFKYLADAKSEAIKACRDSGGEDIEIKKTFNDD